MEVCNTKSHFNTQVTGCDSLANPPQGTRSTGTLCTNNHLHTPLGGQDICIATIFENFYPVQKIIYKYHCYLCFVYITLNKIVSNNNTDKLARMLDLGMLLSKSQDSDHLCMLHCNIKTTNYSTDAS